jgi:uncharacterized membrane protein YvbJ
MKTCTNCGTANTDDARFCEKCGQLLSAAAPAPPINGAPISEGLKIGIIVATIVIPLVGFIMGLIYMNDQNAEKKKAGRTWLYVAIGASVLWCVISLGMGGY